MSEPPLTYFKMTLRQDRPLMLQEHDGLRDHISRLETALDNSQSLLVSILVEVRPVDEIEKQIAENRAALNPDFFKKEDPHANP